ncbi:hypothetical protein Hamer_G001802 [Homarus americanus]|uniref:Secreted protein n=1 Tax=Homarus americanus TaxID=6706 RepID=A0A8J5JWE1_HOMAM|nr:hypothetical protein Hamer_G001802 [Homarus americanus]
MLYLLLLVLVKKWEVTGGPQDLNTGAGCDEDRLASNVKEGTGVCWLRTKGYRDQSNARQTDRPKETMGGARTLERPKGVTGYRREGQQSSVVCDG